MRSILIALFLLLPSTVMAQTLNVGPPQTLAAPTISSGFGTAPSIVNSSGPAAFTINVGTGGTATNGVVQMPTYAPHGWACGCQDTTTVSTTVSQCRSVPTSASTVTLTNYSDVSVAAAWVASDILTVQCAMY